MELRPGEPLALAAALSGSVLGALLLLVFLIQKLVDVLAEDQTSRGAGPGERATARFDCQAYAGLKMPFSSLPIQPTDLRLSGNSREMWR